MSKPSGTNYPYTFLNRALIINVTFFALSIFRKFQMSQYFPEEIWEMRFTVTIAVGITSSHSEQRS